jgi:hypothetical protein
LAVDEDKPSHPRCVIKQFFPQAQGTNTVHKAAELFTQEAVRLDELGKHPQIPELLAYFSQDSQQYLVQEFIDGKDLAQELTANGISTKLKSVRSSGFVACVAICPSTSRYSSGHQAGKHYSPPQGQPTGSRGFWSLEGGYGYSLGQNGDSHRFGGVCGTRTKLRQSRFCQ